MDGPNTFYSDIAMQGSVRRHVDFPQATDRVKANIIQVAREIQARFAPEGRISRSIGLTFKLQSLNAFLIAVRSLEFSHDCQDIGFFLRKTLAVIGDIKVITGSQALFKLNQQKLAKQHFRIGCNMCPLCQKCFDGWILAGLPRCLKLIAALVQTRHDSRTRCGSRSRTHR